LPIGNGLWTLWKEGCAVGNALAFPTASAPVRRRLLAGELSTSPQPIVTLEVVVRTHGVFGCLL